MTASPLPAAPTPTPSSPPGFDAKALLSDIARGAWATLEKSPWLAAILAIFVLTSIVGFVRSVIHGGHPKDIVRKFSQAERRLIFTRAGHRCEHHFPIFGRCRTTTGLEADHVHPHSRGGWTSISNGQALCKSHNREKSARVPWDRQLNNLAKRRASYFPQDHDPVIIRHRPRPTRTASASAPTQPGSRTRRR